jgi:hypothetical protein
MINQLFLDVSDFIRWQSNAYDDTLAPASTSYNSDEAIARLKSLALQAKANGDMIKAKEYLIQMKVRLVAC